MLTTQLQVQATSNMENFQTVNQFKDTFIPEFEALSGQPLTVPKLKKTQSSDAKPRPVEKEKKTENKPVEKVKKAEPVVNNKNKSKAKPVDIKEMQKKVNMLTTDQKKKFFEMVPDTCFNHDGKKKTLALNRI